MSKQTHLLKFTFVILFSFLMQSVQSQNSIYDIQINALDGSKIDLSAYKGKKILFVNTASKCGFTRQYEDLEKLHKTHGDKVVIIGVPCNQFGGQEPGSEEEIATFCKKNYGVTFQMTEKVDVKGSKQHPLYTWLTSKSKNGVQDAKVSWNFNKFLVDEEGNFVKHYQSGVKPLSDKLIGDIEE